MKTNKFLIYLLLTYIIIDLLHLIFFRQEKKHGDGLNSLLTESCHENTGITLIKLVLCIVSLLGLFFLNRHKSFNYLVLLPSLGMVYLVVFRGPLYYFFSWYSTISLWFLFFLGVHLLYLSFIRLKKDDIPN